MRQRSKEFAAVGNRVYLPVAADRSYGCALCIYGADFCTELLSHGVAAIGEKNYLLVLLHSLRFQQFPQTATRFLVISLNKSETLGRGPFIGFRGTPPLLPAMTSNHPSL
jgi:hypothetical protein